MAAQSTGASAPIVAVFQPETHLRIVTIDGQPWFVGKDVCDALAYANATDAMNRHCKGVVKRYPLQTPGGTQEVRVIPQSDMLRLIVGSKLPAAEKFERWVFDEVIPSVLKTGTYTLPRPAEPLQVVISNEQRYQLYEALNRALAGCREFGSSGDQWAWNRIRVKLNLRSINDMHPDQFQDAMAEMQQLQNDIRAYFGFRRELHDFIEREVIGAGTPWTAGIARKYRAKMKALVPQRPEWLALRQQLMAN